MLDAAFALMLAQSDPPPAQPRPAQLCGGRDGWIGRRIGEPGLQVALLPRGHRILGAGQPPGPQIDPTRLTIQLDPTGRIVAMVCR
jgi:hypothetical protein